MTSLVWPIGLVVWPLLCGSLAGVFTTQAKKFGLLGLGGVAFFTLGLAGYGETGSWWLGGWVSPLGIGWRLDDWALLFLLMSGFIGVLVSVYAWWDDSLPPSFWPLWLGAWGAMHALYLSADLFNLYVTLELLGLTSVALVALKHQQASIQAGLRYLLLSLFASMLFLLAIALLYGEYALLDMPALAQVIQPGLVTAFALAAMTVGLLAKTALFPLHTWLPLAHGRAFAPVSAILSALVIKASFYLLMRLWLELFAPLVTLSLVNLLFLLGCLAVLWGAWQALITLHLKRLVAWSTVAQVGYLFIGLGLAAHPDSPPEISYGLLWLILAHALAKSAMFLAAGNLQRAAGHDQLAKLGYALHRSRMTTFSFALAGVSLAGLPISAGFWAKWWLLELALFNQAWWLIAVLLIGSLMTAGYVFRVLNLTVSSQTRPQRLVPIARIRQLLPLLLALFAVGLGWWGQGLWGGVNG